MIAMSVALYSSSEGTTRVAASERLRQREMPRKWSEHKWYFFLPVALFLGVAAYSGVVDQWKVAAIYFTAASFHAVLARRRWEHCGKPSRSGRSTGESPNQSGRVD